MSLDQPDVFTVDLNPHIEWAEHFLDTGDPSTVTDPEVVTIAVALLIGASRIVDRVSRVEAHAFSGTWIANTMNLALAEVRSYGVRQTFDDLLFVVTHVLRERDDHGRHGAELLLALRGLVTS